MKKLSLIICFILLTAMGPSPSGDKSNGRFSPFEIDGLEKNKAPDFTLKDLKGRELSLSSLKGKVVLLNFWATWCPPCKAEMPSLNRLYNDMAAHGIEIIAVSADISIDDVKKYVAKKNYDFRIVFDSDGTVYKKYKVFSLPTTFIIDRDGIIVEKFLGERDWAGPEIKNKIETL